MENTKTLTKLARANINILKVSPYAVSFEFQWRDPRSHAARWSKQVYVPEEDLTPATYIRALEEIYETVQRMREGLEG